MKAALATLLLILVVTQWTEAAIKCVQGDDGKKAAAVCAGANAEATKCSQPKFVEYTGLSTGVKYACGACAKDATAKCEECTGKTDAGCNTPKETGEDFKCFNWEVNAKGVFEQKTATTCKRLKATAVKCNMPGEKADKSYKILHKGCGPCSAADKTAEKCVECDKAECNKQPILCVQGDGKDMKAKPCKAESGKEAATKCHQAKFIEYTGLAAGQNYGCGECPKDSDAKCKSCTGKTDDACNKKIEVAQDFKCYDYELKSDKLVMKSTAGVCKRLKDTVIKCNMPGKKADKTYKVQKKGCGPCTDADKKAEKCLDCTSDSCNKTSSASTITAFTLSMIATLYILL